ncbi:mediator of RNA polymerase II transcription subunit 24-like [Diaphorina citri]|uniref:Mediator of RNA polymerase II transcription subunit 24 n=1 Tax=Diaphorina citri TaxID=121845 RepID=A0A3Q0JCR7_DIACI|nr:mediator of RNA polymerase II transcription subunit 24-like [Diaphorina citri]
MVNFAKNQMETSKVTSKTSSLKALLLKAWCERWTDLHWGTQIKSILPRGVSGDVYNLADIILQQALIGQGPNHLVLSYLKHSLSSQLVSYAAVLQRISKFDGFQKPYCILSLLEFLENIQSGITCKGKPEEGILPGATLSLAHWLLQCLHHTYLNPGDLQQELIKSCLHLLQTMLQCKFTCAMLYLAKHENKDLYVDIVKKCQDILDEPSPELSDTLQSCLQELTHLDTAFRYDTPSECITFCMQPLIAVQVMINPNCNTQTLASQLLLLKRLKNYSYARLYFELLRSSLMSLNDVLDTGEESQWGAFTFIKLPHLLHRLYIDNSDDIVECFEMLLELFPLLDILDARCACNTVESLLTELEKLHILSEQQSKQIIDKRKEATVNLHSPETAPPSISKVTSGSGYLQASVTEKLISEVPHLIPGVQQVLFCCHQNCLRSVPELLEDYHQIRHPKFHTGYTGHMRHKHPELDNDILRPIRISRNLPRESINPSAEEALQSQQFSQSNINEEETQHRMMLNIQEAGARYGMKINVSKTKVMRIGTERRMNVTLDGEKLEEVENFKYLGGMIYSNGSCEGSVVFSENGGDSFFEKWVRDCMVEGGRPKPYKKMLDEKDQAGVDDLLRQFNSSDAEFKNCPKLNCYEICLNIPAVIYDVLGAWETSVLSSTDVKRILDAMRSKMCCLPVCAAAWLCSYMQVIHQEALLKPMNMVQQFLTALTLDETPQQDFFKERSGLMVQIIRKMQCDVFPPVSPKTKVLTLSHCIVSKGSISDQLHSVWESCIAKGWLTIQAAHTFQSMINTCGAEWLVTNLIKEMLKLLFELELNIAVNLVFSIFHLDIEKCTLLLLEHLPQYLHNKFLCGELMEPQSSALARLTTYCIYAAAQVQPTTNRKKKKEEFDDFDEPAAKILRLAQGGVGEMSEGEGMFTPNTPIRPLQEPLLSTVKSLFSYLLIITERPSAICQQTHFVLRFLEYLVSCGQDVAPPVLQHVPSPLVPNLIRALPESIAPSLILKLYDLNTLGGRRDTSRDLCLLRNMQIKTLSHSLG